MKKASIKIRLKVHSIVSVIVTYNFICRNYKLLILLLAFLFAIQIYFEGLLVKTD
jgi:hypothetical protein